MILCIETATTVCSVALCDSTEIIDLKENSEGRSHATTLTVYIEDILKKNGIRTADLDAVAVSKGPGSYTGLRIGVSVAKGIAYGSAIPLIGIDTTLSMVMGFLNFIKGKYDVTETDLLCPLLDARRMEVYYSVYDFEGNPVKDTRAEIIGADSFSEFPESSRIFFFGDGESKSREVIKRENVVFSHDFKVSASSMHMPVYKAFNKKQFEDIAYFEPFYLKDFITSQPVKNILGK